MLRQLQYLDNPHGYFGFRDRIDKKGASDDLPDFGHCVPVPQPVDVLDSPLVGGVHCPAHGGVDE